MDDSKVWREKDAQQAAEVEVAGMGTELQHSLNLFNNLLKNNHHDATLEHILPDTPSSLRNRLSILGISTGFHHLKDFMDTSIGQFDREYVKKMMLKQEEVFRQQVYELHRLYKVQKILMIELNNKKVMIHSLRSASASTSETSHSSNLSSRLQSPVQMNSKDKFLEAYGARAGARSEELGHYSEEISRMQIDFDAEKPVAEHRSLNPMAKHEFEECDVELRLGIGCSSRTNLSNRLD